MSAEPFSMLERDHREVERLLDAVKQH